VRLLFVMNTPGFLRYFDVTVEQLLARGHEVTLAFNRPDMRPESLVTLDHGDRPGLTVLPERLPQRDDSYAQVADAVRATLDFVRYLDPASRRRSTCATVAGCAWCSSRPSCAGWRAGAPCTRRRCGA